MSRQGSNHEIIEPEDFGELELIADHLQEALDLEAAEDAWHEVHDDYDEPEDYEEPIDYWEPDCLWDAY